MTPYGSDPDDWSSYDEDEAPTLPSRELIEADIRIVDSVAAALACGMEVRGRRLEVVVQNRVVILLGEVESEEVRLAAGVVAWAVPEVYDVCNRLTVAP
ncbi:BON domain-containing protein [Paractinoplanes hotanensis]|uniref:BON domain-containing protein n=1 Tax=Paractinoplanes hotanensis TaxID=2906497 RepID=A0ABT0YE74_9ACTN|nr:BON domain-containing protein [Actinoplanes hotanensis]MCM4083808.1 BON domain-containing protein [Actinoplanes hotanensis]